jgi:uncharacterized integral membrane protein
MVLIGFVLLVAAAVFGIDVVAQNRFDVDIEVFGQVFTSTPAVVFVTGVVAGIVAALGMMLLRDGLGRRRQLGKDAKHAKVHHQPADDVELVDLREQRQRAREHVSTF